MGVKIATVKRVNSSPNARRLKDGLASILPVAIVRPAKLCLVI